MSTGTINRTAQNIDPATVRSFGDEWSRFTQRETIDELERIFRRYFAIFPWKDLPEDATGADIGCGSGRWATFVAPRVGHLHCVDPSGRALEVARGTLSEAHNVTFHQAGVTDLPFSPNSLDFAYSLGVLHHVPDTTTAIESCVRHLKPGAPLLLYLYYSLDNRPSWFRRVWKLSNLGRRWVSGLPAREKAIACDAIAAGVYFPLARLAWLGERMGVDVGNIPLAAYRSLSFYAMRTDSRDRFGTPLEQRFSRAEIQGMMEDAGLERVRFHSAEPFWCSVGFKAG